MNSGVEGATAASARDAAAAASEKPSTRAGPTASVSLPGPARRDHRADEDERGEEAELGVRQPEVGLELGRERPEATIENVPAASAASDTPTTATAPGLRSATSLIGPRVARRVRARARPPSCRPEGRSCSVVVEPEQVLRPPARPPSAGAGRVRLDAHLGEHVHEVLGRDVAVRAACRGACGSRRRCRRSSLRTPSRRRPWRRAHSRAPSRSCCGGGSPSRIIGQRLEDQRAQAGAPCAGRRARRSSRR